MNNLSPLSVLHLGRLNNGLMVDPLIRLSLEPHVLSVFVDHRDDGGVVVDLLGGGLENLGSLLGPGDHWFGDGSVGDCLVGLSLDLDRFGSGVDLGSDYSVVDYLLGRHWDRNVLSDCSLLNLRFHVDVLGDQLFLDDLSSDDWLLDDSSLDDWLADQSLGDDRLGDHLLGYLGLGEELLGLEVGLDAGGLEEGLVLELGLGLGLGGDL